MTFDDKINYDSDHSEDNSEVKKEKKNKKEE